MPVLSHGLILAFRASVVYACHSSPGEHTECSRISFRSYTQLTGRFTEEHLEGKNEIRLSPQFRGTHLLLAVNRRRCGKYRTSVGSSRNREPQ
ncbi:hypothetical protein B0T24DRAFT_428942 [Lasiosphaeria ovina]|uniref:Secreted protein n=1 Tax=Lasiosphaeria ovina TaxID=92902 RepID=A0AAE0JWH4_9PEZI|nr:hypothetical protein B0T24DRAFT_428942 [Lasiosphaeria ovina]